MLTSYFECVLEFLPSYIVVELMAKNKHRDSVNTISAYYKDSSAWNNRPFAGHGHMTIS